MFGDHLFNNLGHLIPHADYVMADNGEQSGEDVGVIMPGINEDFADKAPDCGAYEHGVPKWKAGHDFAKPPNPVYALSRTPLRNHLSNSCFEYGRWGLDPLDPWQRTDAKQAQVIHADGFVEHYNTRTSIFGFSVHLLGETDDGITQTVTGLLPNTRYRFAGYTRVKDAAAVRLEVTEYGGQKVVVSAANKQWTVNAVEFTTGLTDTSATVTVRKVGPGVAYVDECGVMMVWTNR